MKTELLNFLDRKIDGCTELGDMDREKWAFIQVKKFINSERYDEAKAVRQNEDKEKICNPCKGSGIVTLHGGATRECFACNGKGKQI